MEFWGLGFTGKQGTYASPLARDEAVREIKGGENGSDACGDLQFSCTAGN